MQHLLLHHMTIEISSCRKATHHVMYKTMWHFFTPFLLLVIPTEHVYLYTSRAQHVMILKCCMMIL